MGEAITWKVDDTLRERIVRASFEPTGIGALEEHEALDLLSQIADPSRGLGFSPGGACAGSVSLLARYVQWLLAAILLGVVTAWWLALAAAAGALAVRIGVRSGLGRLGAFEGRHAPQRRRRDYFGNLLAGGGPAKEVRVFGLLDWLQERYRTHALDAVEPVWRFRRRIVYVPYAISLPLAFAFSALATVVTARAAARGEVTLGEMAFALQAIVLVNGLGGFFWESDWQTEHGLGAYDALERFEALAGAQRGAEAAAEDPDGRPRREIAFEGVRFGYPGADREVLHGLDLTIPAGRSLAIVGLNGAGKTTLVKLLARLYDRRKAASPSTASTCAPSRRPRGADGSARSSRISSGTTFRSWTTSASARPSWPATRSWCGRCWRAPARRKSSTRCRTACTRRCRASTPTAPNCRAGSGSGSRSRAR